MQNETSKEEIQSMASEFSSRFLNSTFTLAQVIRREGDLKMEKLATFLITAQLSLP